MNHESPACAVNEFGHLPEQINLKIEEEEKKKPQQGQFFKCDPCFQV